MRPSILKSISAAVIAGLLLSACNSEKTTETSGRTDTAASAAVPAADLRSRQIAALQELAQQLQDSSGGAFSNAFSFPVPEDVFYPYVDDESFSAAYKQAGNQMTKDLFLQYYPDLARNLELAEFRELFRRIPPERLRTSDSLHTEDRRPGEACLRYYDLQIKDRDLTVQYGSDHDYSFTAGEDADTEVCEWATIWTFRFDGRSWRFVQMFQAG